MKNFIKQPTIKFIVLNIAGFLILFSCNNGNLNVALQQASENRSMPAFERYFILMPQIYTLGENDPTVSFSESVKRNEYSGNKN